MKEQKGTESVRVPTAVLDRVRRLAEQERRPLTTQIEILLEMALESAPELDTARAA